MISAYSAAAVRAAELPLLQAGHGPELMRLAAHGLAMGVLGALRSRARGAYGSSVFVLVGSGNNGGDALYAAALLAARGARTTAFLASSRTHPEALAAFVTAGGRCISGASPAADRVSGTVADQEPLVAEAAAHAVVSDVVIDGLLGTGGRGGLRGTAAALVARMETHFGTGRSGKHRPLVVACDVPSGIDATTGEVHEPVLRADRTITFGAYKTGLLVGPAEQLCGAVTLVDIGIEDMLNGTGARIEAEVTRLELADLGAMLPEPSSRDQKYTRGVAGIIAGSGKYPGAALLAVSAASACGPGMVRYVGPESVSRAMHFRNPEVVCSNADPETVRVQAWLLGPGAEDDAEGDGGRDDTGFDVAAHNVSGGDVPAEGMTQGQRIHAVLFGGGHPVPTVVDAAALEFLPVPPAHTSPAAGSDSWILTPHAGELAALFSRQGVDLDRAAIESAPLAAVRRAAQLFGAVVLLKGATTLIATPDGQVISQANGTAHLATAGSGDTLGGILVALLAMNREPGTGFRARTLAHTAALAAALHGELAREVPGRPLQAGQLSSLIPKAWVRLRAEARDGVVPGSAASPCARPRNSRR